VSPHTLGTLAATAVFCAVFLRGGRLLALLGRLGHRTAVSVAGGAAVAYVFVDLSPELHAAAGAFQGATSRMGGTAARLGVYLATMAGFLFFYGLEELVIRSQTEEERRRRRELGKMHRLFLTHMAAFAAYAWTVTCLMARSPGERGVQLVFYAAAMTLHFVSVAHALQEEHGALYVRAGSRVLAASCAAGWMCGTAFGMPGTVLGLLLGCVAGGVIANTIIAELPREREGRFVPFLAGAAGYTALLLLAG
jgi:hypothetical protein